ncbi:MAG TPA: CPBP family intramembrane metalloprotease domain-containing protein [Anaerolineae bacterium]|jgi:membrane protease YdiL (CAAX protease family)|nr:CPBP family intramembrane metalloprotease domain-containing protein [Anaerolineae bacterium]
MFPWITENRLFILARQAARLPHILIVLLLGLAIALLSQFGAIPVIVTQVLIYGFSETGVETSEMSALVSGSWMAATLISSFAGIFLFLWLWTRFFEKRSLASLGLELPGALIKYARGFLFGIILFGGAVGLLAVAGFVEIEQGNPSTQGAAALGGVLIVLIGWIVQGAGEEVLTRGWMLPVLSARYKPWVGIIVSSLFFAVLHGLNPNLSVIAMINLALFGFFAAFYALREGSLWGICALHSVWNWVQGNIFGFEVSGGSFGGGTLLNLMETGPDWFTGGPFGPEGGLAVTIMLLVGMAFIFFWPAKTQETFPESMQE